MSAIPVFDPEHLPTILGGDTDLQRELLALFREQCAKWLPLLDPKDESVTWKHAAHGIKSSAAGVGAAAVIEACKAAEAVTGAAGTPVSRALKLEALRAAVDAAVAEAARIEHRLGSSFRSGAA